MISKGPIVSYIWVGANYVVSQSGTFSCWTSGCRSHALLSKKNKRMDGRINFAFMDADNLLFPLLYFILIFMLLVKMIRIGHFAWLALSQLMVNLSSECQIIIFAFLQCQHWIASTPLWCRSCWPHLHLSRRTCCSSTCRCTPSVSSSIF